MKKLLMAFLTIATSGVMAQNYKSLHAPVNYLSIPKIIQDASFNTYSLGIDGYEDDLNNLGYSLASIASKLNLRAFTRVNGEGENNVVFRFSGYGNLRGVLSSQRGSDNKEYFYYIYNYTLPMSYEIYAGAKKIAGSEIKMPQQNYSVNVEQFSYSTKSFPNSTDATNYWNSKGKEELFNQIKKNFDTKFEIFLKSVREDIDYQFKKDETKFGIFKSTKKADYSDYENAAESAKRALAPLVAGEPRVGLRERLDSAMTFWKNKMKALDPKNKDQDKLFFACANNLAVAYYWIDNIDSAQYYIGEADKADVRDGYLAMLKYDVETRKKQLNTLKVFGIDPYLGPAPATQDEVNAIADKAEKARMERDAEIAARKAAAEKKYAPVIEDYDGYIIGRDDKKVTGKFKCYKENNGSRTGKNYFIADGTIKETELSSSFIKSCEFGSFKYETVKYIDASGLGKETNLLLMVYESDKIKVYKSEEKVGTSGSLTYVYYKRPNEDVAVNTSNLNFSVNLKKHLAKYFEDCPTVANKALAGDYTDSVEMRVAAAIDYSNCK